MAEQPEAGRYAGCFSASYFDLADAINWGGKNSLVVRIGAHPAVLPDNYPVGSDFEKIKWTPGIYDSVSVFFCANPVIETIQVAPRVARSEIEIQTRLRNHGTAPASFTLNQSVRPWRKGQKPAAAKSGVLQALAQAVALDPGEEKVVTQTLAIPNAVSP